jgi:hypothetical protein
MKTMARANDKAEILGRVKLVRHDSVRRWGRMSAHQMVCHLSDAFRHVTREKSASSTSTILGPTVIKWIALYAPLPWPRGVPTRPEMDQDAGGTKPAEFAVDLAALEQLIEVIASRPMDYDWPAHPFFGTMSRSAWLRWAYLHMDHHLRQFGH